ncbi:MAG TPA: pilin, partial [Patescibacteria group bacterium]|nr:pilin [Patescibacteria group bacterium]
MSTRFARAAAILCLAIAGLVSTTPALAENMNPGFTVPAESQGDLRVPIGTEVPIPVPNPETVPGSTAEKRLQYLTEGKVEDLAQYIGIVYNFLISIAGMVAAVMMIVGGFQYLTSAGDSSKIGQAKSRMANAFIGLVLALGAYTILNTINPALLRLSLPDLRGVTAVTFFWPWCEDIQGDPAVDPSKFKVTLVSGAAANGEPQCGSVGEYRLTKTASTTGPCVYRGGSAVKIHQAKIFNEGKLIEEE